MPSQRTKELTPQRSSLTIKPNTTMTNQLKAAVRVKQGLKLAKMRLISLIMAPPLLAAVVFKANVLGAVRINVWPALIFFKDCRNDGIAVEFDLVMLFSHLDDFRYVQGMPSAVEYVSDDIDIRRTFLESASSQLLKPFDDFKFRLYNLPLDITNIVRIGPWHILLWLGFYKEDTR